MEKAKVPYQHFTNCSGQWLVEQDAAASQARIVVVDTCGKRSH